MVCIFHCDRTTHQSFILVSGYILKLSNNGPIVRGGTISFKAVLYNNDGTLASGSFKFVWNDNAIPSHSISVRC